MTNVEIHESNKKPNEKRIHASVPSELFQILKLSSAGIFFSPMIYTQTLMYVYIYTYVCIYRLGLRTRVVEKKGKACGVWTTFLTTLSYGVYERDGGRLNLFMLSHLNDRVVVVE